MFLDWIFILKLAEHPASIKAQMFLERLSYHSFRDSRMRDFSGNLDEALSLSSETTSGKPVRSSALCAIALALARSFLRSYHR
jgi:hypothetical protein